MSIVYNTNKWHDYLWDSANSDSRDAAVVKGEIQGFSQWEDFGKEVFSRLYSSNVNKVDKVASENKWAEKAHALADELPEFSQLQSRCKGDKLWSNLGTMGLMDTLLGALPKPTDPAVKELPKIKQMVKGLESMAKHGIPVTSELATAQEKLAASEKAAEAYADSIDASTVRSALRAGMEEANEKMDEYTSVMSSFGYGEGDPTGKGGDLQSKTEIFNKVRNNAKLRKLADLAGRMRLAAARKQRNKSSYSRDEISDITTGDDISRLLPSELAKLTNPLLRKVFFRDFLEKNLLSYELKGTEHENKGPVIVCIDNSGSMSGDNELWSKAVALALLDIARKQKRAFQVIHFDTKVQSTFTTEKGKAVDHNALMDCMNFFSGGGTSFEAPLHKAVETIKGQDFKKADVILITDGEASTKYADEYKKAMKDSGATTYGVMIGGDYYGATQVLKAYCDKVIKIADLDNPNAVADTLFDI
jgi:uncharacterized protein with von Willebrand factor type A (vWA) domain